MPNIVRALIHDPSYKAPIGHVALDSNEFQAMKLRGCRFVPVDEDLAPPNALSGLDGFVFRYWGTGWPLLKGSAERACPMAIKVHPDRHSIYWMVQLRPLKGMRPTGRVRLAPDTSQAGYINSGLSQIEQPDLFEKLTLDRFDREQGTITIHGECSISVPNEGLLSLYLHAVASNVRVVWTAVSVASQRVAW